MFAKGWTACRGLWHNAAMAHIIETAKAKIKGRGLRLVLPEADDPRIQATARLLHEEGLALPLLQLAQPSADTVQRMIAMRPSVTPAIARRLLAKPLYAAGAMVAAGMADAMLAGVAQPTYKVIEAALMTIGLADGIKTPSSFIVMQWPKRLLLFADCAVNVQPSAAQLADIAVATAQSAAQILQDKPRVALLSFSTLGSAKHADADKVIAATALAKTKAPHFDFAGEMQGDAALSPEIALRKIGVSGVAGHANVLIFPDLDAGNIAYKLCQQLGGGKAIGPILQGFSKPVSDLSRGASVDEIVATACLLLSMVD